jgi:hypothetical protein
MVKVNEKHDGRGKKKKTFLYKKVKNFNHNANRYSEALDRVPNWPDQVLKRPDLYSSNNWRPNEF